MIKRKIKWGAVQDGSHLLDETNRIRIEIHTLPKLAACNIFNKIYNSGDADSFRIALQHDPKYYTIYVNIHSWYKRLLAFKLYMISQLGKNYKSGYFIIKKKKLVKISKEKIIIYLRKGYNYTKVDKSYVFHKRKHI